MPETVLLNVYELIPSDSKGQTLGKDALDLIGMGIFHTGIEIFGEEISFGLDPTGRNDPATDGVFIVQPRSAVGTFRESIVLGTINLEPDQANQVLQSMMPQWKAQGYHLLTRNCNCFTFAFAEALGGPRLVANYPKWVNRAASVGGVVVPEALLRSLTAAVAPPGAVPPDLINKIMQPNPGPVPRPLPPCQPASAPAPPPPPSGGFGGLMGMAKGVASKVATTVGSVIDAPARQELAKCFPAIPPTALIAAFGVHVIHINRDQAATLYVTTSGLAFHGTNKLSLVIPFAAIVSLQFALKRDIPEQRNLPPTFEPMPANAAVSGDGANAVKIYLYDNTVLPIFNIGNAAAKVVVKTIGKVVGATTHAQDLLAAMDREWRKQVAVPA